MTPSPIAFPARRAAAERNREKILSAARAAFADPTVEVSMAEIARRAEIGMATLYRNFPGRRELLEALYEDEVEALCLAAGLSGGRDAGVALTSWLRRVFAFVLSKRLVIAELLQQGDGGAPTVGGNRARALAAGRPLLTAAQDAGEVRRDLSLEQVFDMIVAIAKIGGDPSYLEPMLQTTLDGLRAAPDRGESRARSPRARR